MGLLPRMCGAAGLYRPLTEVKRRGLQEFAGSPLTGSNIDECLHDHSPSSEGLFASQELMNEKWESQPLCNTVLTHFFASVFCSVSVKSSDRSECVLSLRPDDFLQISLREAETPLAFGFLLPAERAKTSGRVCICAIAPTVPLKGPRILYAVRRGFSCLIGKCQEGQVGSKDRWVVMY